MSANDNSDCGFCSKFGSDSGATLWYDQVMHSSGGLVVVPAVGPLVEGYSLILSRKHYGSVSEFPEDLLTNLVNLKEQVRRVFRRMYTEPIFFEHGASRTAGRGGSCIDHAHLHVVPTKLDLESLLSAKHAFQQVKSLWELEKFRNKSYLFFETQAQQMYVAEVSDVPGQYIRRLLSDAMGLEDQWDYAAYPNYDLIETTLSRLVPWPST